MTTATYTDVLKNPHFRYLWLAQIFSQLAQHMLNFALIIVVFDVAQNTRFANLAVSLLVLSFAIPSLLFGAIAGIYVDHLDNKKVLIITNFLRSILVLLYFIVGTQLIPIYLITFAISSITQFFVPAESSSIPRLVKKNHLLQANSMFITTLYASFIVGYSMAGPLIRFFSPDGVYAVSAVMFATAGFFVLGLPRLQSFFKETLRFRHVFKSVTDELRRSWTVIRGHRGIFFPIMQLTISQAIVGVIIVLAPAFTKEVLGFSIKDASHILVAPAGLGMVAGAFLLGRFAGRLNKVRLVSWSLFVSSIALAFLALSDVLNFGIERILSNLLGNSVRFSHFLVVIFISLVLGSLNSIISVASQTILQEHTSKEVRGRVFGALNMMVNIAATLPILVVGILADLFTVTQVILAVALFLLIYALVQLRWVHATKLAQYVR